MPLLAQELVDSAPIKVAVGGFVVAVVSFLCWYFKKWMNKTEERNALMEDRISWLEVIATSNIQFTAGVMAASQAGPTVDSSLIHNLYDQHKPSDLSGIHKPLIIPKERKK